MINFKDIFFSALFLGITSVFLGQSNCFPKVKDNYFIYDQAEILSSSQETELNNKLRKFTKSTSNVLVIVTTPDLCGYDKAAYTYTFADEKGVGREDLDNGVVLMVKPKEVDGVGETFIAVGNGLQGAIPDLVASRDIVRKELIPSFKQKDYYGGIVKASDVIMALASGEISHEDYSEGGGNFFVVIIFIVIFIIIFSIAQRRGGNDDDDWKTFDRGGGRVGRRSSGGWIWIGGGGIGGGGGSGGGGFGGFGGFGGGGFDGGGAGGSW